MSWINESSLSWHTILMMRLLKCGRIPKHIAFIMDGNRRYARKANVEKIQGHSKGFDKLSEVLRWCLDLGVKEVTVYAFSIENFKRTQEEVDSLMDLAREKFHRLLLEKEKLKKHGVKIRIIGNMSYIPEDIVKLMADAEFITRNNEQALLNVAFSYTAQDEITAACNTALKGLNDGHIDEIDVSVGLLSRCLYTNGSPFPEMIIRTSGETRLSDYLLWQGCASYLHFTGALWPELGARDFLWAVFKYQRVADEIDALSAEIHANPMSYRQKSFVESVKNKSWIELKRFVSVE